MTQTKKKNKKRAKKQKSNFDEQLLDLARVTRVVAGGKRFRFRAVMAVGDRRGKVGVGAAKGADVVDAIHKAVFQAKKNLITAPIVDGTIPHEITAKYNAARVYLKPAPKGRGINAGGAVRVLCDLAGFSDVVGKTLSRTTNKLNTARATLRAFERINATLIRRGQKPAKKDSAEKEKEEKAVIKN